MFLRGETIQIDLATTGSIDGFNASGFERVEVENVLVEPESTAELDSMPLQDEVFCAIKAHFPKTFTRSLYKARIHYGGRVYHVEGDPAPFSAHLTPGKWNRTVYAYTTNATGVA